MSKNYFLSYNKNLINKNEYVIHGIHGISKCSLGQLDKLLLEFPSGSDCLDRSKAGAIEPDHNQ